jgi:hypothetical protein
VRKHRELESLAPFAFTFVGGCVATVCILHRSSNANTVPLLALIVAIVALVRTFRR